MLRRPVDPYLVQELLLSDHRLVEEVREILKRPTSVEKKFLSCYARLHSAYFEALHQALRDLSLRYDFARTEFGRKVVFDVVSGIVEGTNWDQVTRMFLMNVDYEFMKVSDPEVSGILKRREHSRFDESNLTYAVFFLLSEMSGEYEIRNLVADRTLIMEDLLRKFLVDKLREAFHLQRFPRPDKLAKEISNLVNWTQISGMVRSYYL